MDEGSVDRFTVRAPATSGNIGPGFDCIALTLDLWNEVHVEVGGEGVVVDLQGAFTENIPVDETNLIVHTINRRLRERGAPRPKGLRLTCVNEIPPNSGLGSSSAVLALGLMIADTLCGAPLDHVELMRRVAAIEGHADNAAGVAFGGLTLIIEDGGDYIWRTHKVPEMLAAVVTPPAHYSTRQARSLLPQAAPLADAVFNMGRLPLVIEAVSSGDLELLHNVLDDRLHQRYRLALTPGADEALVAAQEAGAVGAVVSGSGPSLLAFVRDRDEAERVGEAMIDEFRAAGVTAQLRIVTATNEVASCRGTL